MKKVLFMVGGLMTIAVIAGAAGGRSTERGSAERPGNPAVYAQLAAETDCSALQASFDQAEVTHRRGGSWGPLGTSYMEAADARMRAIGCY